MRQSSTQSHSRERRLCACEHPDDFARHRRAVTDEGLRKESERRAVKDDRRDLRASQYIYQGNIEDKIVALREELYEAQDAAEAADQAMDEVLTKHSALGLEKERWSKLHSQFEQFSQIDATAAEAAVQRLRDQLDALLEANPDLTELKKQAEQYLEDITALSERMVPSKSKRAPIIPGAPNCWSCKRRCTRA